MGKSGLGGNGRYSHLSVAKSVVDQASWEDVEAEEIWRTIMLVTNAGDALTFSKTRDGGAVGIVILSDGPPQKLYAHNAEEMRTLLANIRAGAESAS